MEYCFFDKLDIDKELISPRGEPLSDIGVIKGSILFFLALMVVVSS